jgi:hypothetical protein
MDVDPVDVVLLSGPQENADVELNPQKDPCGQIVQLAFDPK